MDSDELRLDSLKRVSLPRALRGFDEQATQDLFSRVGGMYEAALEQVAALRIERHELQSQRDDLSKALIDRVAELSSLRAEMTALESQLAEVQGEAASMGEKLDETRRELRATKATGAAESAKAKELGTRNARDQHRIQTLEEQLTEAAQSRQALALELAESSQRIQQFEINEQSVASAFVAASRAADELIESSRHEAEERRRACDAEIAETLGIARLEAEETLSRAVDDASRIKEDAKRVEAAAQAACRRFVQSVASSLAELKEMSEDVAELVGQSGLDLLDDLQPAQPEVLREDSVSSERERSTGMD